MLWLPETLLTGLHFNWYVMIKKIVECFLIFNLLLVVIFDNYNKNMILSKNIAIWKGGKHAKFNW